MNQDCRLWPGNDLQPKEERLISYAIDLGVEVEPVVNEAKDRIIQVKIIKGVLEATHKVRDRGRNDPTTTESMLS